MALGLGAGGAAAAGLQSGFEMGRQADQDIERKAQTARNNARQDQLDTERRDQITRQNALVDKAQGEHDEERQLQGANTAIEDARYQLGALHQKYPDGNIPDTEARPLYEAVGKAHGVRQQLIQKRYQPIIDATTQKWRDFASKAQVGQADPSTLRGQDLRDFIKATTGHDLSEFANGNIGGAINDTTTGMQTQNQGLTIKGSGVLLGPQVRQGVGGIAPDGSQIVDKSLFALVPAPRQQPQQAPQSPLGGLSAALDAASSDSAPGETPAAAPGAPAPAGPGPADPSAAASPQQSQVPDSDPSHVIPVLDVTTRQPDGTLTKYHAPVTDGRSTDPNAAIAGPLDTQGLTDRMGRLGVVDNWLKTPEMAGAVQEALKDGTPTSFDQAWGMVHGDPKAFNEKDATSQKIAAIKKLQKDEGYASFEEAARVFDGRGSKGKMGALEQKLTDIADDPDLTDDEKAAARKVAIGIAKVDSKHGGMVGMGVKGGGGGGASGKGGSPLLGGVGAPDPKAAYDKAVEFYARLVIAGDKDWQTGLARGGKDAVKLIKDVKLRVPGLAGEMGLDPQDIGTARAQSAALGATLKDLTKRSAAVDLFSSKVEKDMVTLDNLLDKASTGSPLLISKPVNQLRRQFSDPELSQLDLAAQQVGTEYERLITGGSLSVAQLHSGAQEDARKLINGDMTPKQARAIMKIMRVEIGNARSAAHESTARIQDQLNSLGRGRLGTGAAPSGASAPAGAAPAGGAPKQIASDADYNALPSGTTFIGPDGKTRRKP